MDADDNFTKTDDVSIEIERPKRNKDGCMSRLFKKIFFALYPSHPKKTWTKQGEWLRKMLLMAIILHCVFFIASLALIGFETMVINLLLCCWAYSVYLTLNQCSIILYIFFLLSGASCGLFYGLGKKTQSYQITGLLANVAC